MKIFWFLAQEQFQPEVLVEQAQLVERSGFDGVAVSDHFHPFVDDAGASGFAWAILGAIAAATERLELATAVVTPLWRYHPAVVAQAAATVDRLSGGRFALGVGTGRNEGALGFPYPNYAERAARMEEALLIMRQLLDGERLDFDGRFYKTRGAKLYSPAVSRVPIYLSAAGPKSAKLGAAKADGLIVSVKNVDEDLERVVQPAAEETKQIGRDKPVVMATQWTVRGRGDDEAWQALASQRGLRAPNRDSEIDPAKLRQAADQLPREEVLSKYRRVQEAADYVAAYAEIVQRLRPDILVIQTTSVDQTNTIEMVGREVVPELQKLSKGGTTV
jgi:coenzyme F420-dependent glucose-6-phosphate dehydrogenase